MRIIKLQFTQRVLASLAVLTWIVPVNYARASAPQPPSKITVASSTTAPTQTPKITPKATPNMSMQNPALISDIALRPGGTLLGQLITSQGAPLGGQSVRIQQGKFEPVYVKTDENGWFSAPGLRGGVYVVSSTGALQACRLWAQNTAPPSASGSLLLAQPEVVRGQEYTPYQPARKLFRTLLIGAAIAAAIAIPIALVNRDKEVRRGS